MGTSTRRITPRSGNVISEAVNSGKLQVNGKGIGDLLADLIYSSKGQTKIIRTVNSVFSSSNFGNALSGIIKLKKELANSKMSSIIGFENLEKNEKVEKVIEFLGIGEEKYLSQAFKNVSKKKDIFSKAVGHLEIIRLWIKEIYTIIINSFSREDITDILPEVKDEILDQEIDEILDEISEKVYDTEFGTLVLNIVDDKPKLESELSKKKVKFLGLLKVIGG